MLYNTDFVSAIKKNKRNSWLLVIYLIIIMVILGYLIGWFIELEFSDQTPQTTNDIHAHQNIGFMILKLSSWGLTGAFLAASIAILWSSIALFLGDKIVLFATGSKELDPKENPILANVVEEMSIAAGISPPKTYIIETDALNAFATGLNTKKSYIAVTRGLLNSLSREELQGVVAHEISHVINFDVRYQTLVSVIVGLIILLSDFGRRAVFYSALGRSNNRNKGGAAGILGLVVIFFSIIAPIASLLLQMSVSRQREYLADATSVKLTRNPLGLISALQKLANSAKIFEGANRGTQHLFIINPFRNVGKTASSLFSTHPPVEDRIKRLRNLGEKREF